MDEVARIARERRPKLLLAGWSAYPRQLDFARFREIADEVGALLMVDMAHFAGLVAAGLHPNPVELGADVVTTTTHKTLGGPRAGVILCKAGARQEDRLGRLPRPAGRPARARDRGQGGGASRSPRASCSPSASGARVDGAQALAERAAEGGPRRQRADRRHRRAPGARRPARQRARADAAGRPRTACTRSTSPSTATRCRSTRARRWRPRGCASARRRWPRAACSTRTSSRSGGSSRSR